MEIGSLGHYRILEKIGSGGMGEVYRALDTRLARTVALKILSPETAKRPGMRKRFEREGQAVAALQHPNILTIYSVEETDGQMFFSMELIEGRNLSDTIPVGGYPLGQFLDLAIELVDAVSWAHRKGITHRDLKPANVMVNQDGRLKVLDFGLARIVEPEMPGPRDPGGATVGVTEDGVIIGTVAYMSPEQLRGLPVDHRTDIFSLGIVLYEMLTGTNPFWKESSADLISSILRDRPSLASLARPDVPRRLAQVIDRCLEKDPNVRLQSALALRNDLEEIKRHVETLGDERFCSIALLTPVDLSPDGDQGYFCEGLADELLKDLVGVRTLRVAPATTTMLMRRATPDPLDVGRRLGVEAILQGSVRKVEDRLRITAELLDVETGRLLWAEQFDRDRSDAFQIQAEIARNIVEALRVSVTTGERRSLESRATADAEAYDYYLRGRRFFYQYRRRGIELALHMFRLATKHDPLYALAYAGIADCFCFLYLYADRSPSTLDEADQASRRALELDPDLAEAHASRGQVLSLGSRHGESEAEFETAVRLGPKLFEAYYLYGRDSFAQGKLEKAANLFELASTVRPDDYQAPLLVAQVYERLDRPADARASQARGVRIAEERLKLDPDDVRALYMGANGLISMGERDRALEWASLALEMEPDEPMVLYNVACIFSLAGSLDEAIDYLERAVRLGLRQLGWFQNDSNLDPLRTLPRFALLMKELQ